MGYIARLTKGSRVLDLNSGVYSLGLDFVPPPINVEPLLATGTAANKQGSSKRGERPLDRNWSFTVKVRGGSEAQCRIAATPLLNMLALAGDEDEPLYFEWRGNSDVPYEPTYGQYGVNLRYEIIHASGIQAWELYPVSDMRSGAVNYTVNLTIKPYALGKRQRLASATGGVLENTYGTADGRSRGLLVPGEVTNKMTNPIFGAGAATGWTASGSMLASVNADPQYVMFGNYSVRLVNRGATANTYTMSIAAGNTLLHTISAYVKLPDGGEVTEGDINIYYDGSSMPTKRANLGNGFWMLSQSVTAVSGATTVGIEIIEDRNCYLCGMQFEQLVANQQITATPLCHGDLLGCAWTGTAHASTSTRAAAEVTLSLDINNYNPGQGTIRTVWNAPLENTYPSAYLAYLWQVGAVALYYDEADSAFHFSGIESAAYELQEDGTDPIVIHCTWGETGIQLAVNGTIVSSATFAAATMPSEISIGSANGIGPAGGTFMDFSIYTHPMTAAEIAADYANIIDHVGGGDGFGQQLAPIPWLWTKDGDNQVDNCDDSTRDNWIVCGGVPGNADAKTLIITANANDFSIIGSIYLTKYALRHRNQFYPPDDYAFIDLSGTADGGSAGGEFKRVSVSTSETNLSGNLSLSLSEGNRNLIGKHLTAICRVKDNSASTLQLAFRLSIGGTVHTTAYQTVTTSTSYRLFRTISLTVPTLDQLLVSDLVSRSSLTLSVQAKRPTGVSTANVDIDYVAIFPAPLEATDGTNNDLGIAYEGNRLVGVGTTSTPGAIVSHTGVLSLRGTELELSPDCLNLIMSLQGNATVAATITWTMTYYIFVTPRWALLN